MTYITADRTVRKATHTGTCQVCGATQKLPYALLSKHGYTTRFGWFEGTCSGSERLPFEQSKDLIEGAIKSTEEMIERTLAEMKNLETETEYVWINFYSRRSYSHRWIKIEKDSLTVKPHRNPDLKVVGYQAEGERFSEIGTLFPVSDYREVASTVEEEIIKTNSQYIWHLTNQVTAMRNYIRWQETRIADWKLADLTPIKTKSDA